MDKIPPNDEFTFTINVLFHGPENPNIIDTTGHVVEEKENNLLDSYKEDSK